MRPDLSGLARHRITREDKEAILLARPGAARAAIQWDSRLRCYIAAISGAAPLVTFTGRGQTPREAFDRAYAQVQR